jgi:hypothetical protein
LCALLGLRRHLYAELLVGAQQALCSPSATARYISAPCARSFNFAITVALLALTRNAPITLVNTVSFAVDDARVVVISAECGCPGRAAASRALLGRECGDRRIGLKDRVQKKRGT